MAGLSLAVQSCPDHRAKCEGDGFLPGLLWVTAGQRSWSCRSSYFLPETLGWEPDYSQRTGLRLALLEQGRSRPSCPKRTRIKPVGTKSRIYCCWEWKYPANRFRHRGSNYNFRALSLHFLASFQPLGGQNDCYPSGNRVLISGRKVPRRALIGQASVKCPITVPWYWSILIGQPGLGHRVSWMAAGQEEGWQAHILQ